MNKEITKEQIKEGDFFSETTKSSLFYSYYARKNICLWVSKLENDNIIRKSSVIFSTEFGTSKTLHSLTQEEIAKFTEMIRKSEFSHLLPLEDLNTILNKIFKNNTTI